MNNARDNRGFTLMEMVVVLAVIAILAAILTPIINSYIDRARFNSAHSDVKNIAAAIVQFNTDTRVWPIYKGTFTSLSNPTFITLTTEGNDATDSSAGMTWTIAPADAGSLNGVLNTNTMNLTTSGARAFKGAYLQDAPDPWGSKYYVTAANLAPNSNNAAYVISAGPNQALETTINQTRIGTIVVGGDDIVQRIR
jgi:prepilin-type N-terminal cleavage/methylation domain-containing protein